MTRTDVEGHEDKRIVVGVDGSQGSKDALSWAARQAETTGARLQVVMAWHIVASAYGAPLPVLTGYDLGPSSEAVVAEMVSEVLREHPGLRISSAVVEGHPAPKLIQAAVGAELLVVGSRGHGAFTGMLLGSVSEHCVTHSPCPVVVVRHSADAV